MSVSLPRRDALFLHIPKTGGSWIEQALIQAGIRNKRPPTVPGVTWRHSLLSMLTRRYRFVFTFVRHPLTWYESWWKFQAGIWTIFEPGVWHPQRTLERCQADDFSEFIRLCIKHEPGYVSRMYEWYIGPEGYEFVSFVGRHENLTADLVHVLKLLGENFDQERLQAVQPVNISRKVLGEPIWDPVLRRQIIELEAPAIRRFYTHWPDRTKPDRHVAPDSLAAATLCENRQICVQVAR
jgi:hypothetical protein